MKKSIIILVLLTVVMQTKAEFASTSLILSPQNQTTINNTPKLQDRGQFATGGIATTSDKHYNSYNAVFNSNSTPLNINSTTSITREGIPTANLSIGSRYSSHISRITSEEDMMSRRFFPNPNPEPKPDQPTPVGDIPTMMLAVFMLTYIILRKR